MADIRGYAYPFSVQGGDLVIKEGANLIRCHIYHILETELFENPMRPEYGVNHPLFEAIPGANRVNSKQEYLNRVNKALQKYLSSSTFTVNLSEPNDNGEMVLDIYWSYEGVRQEPIELIVS